MWAYVEIKDARTHEEAFMKGVGWVLRVLAEGCRQSRGALLGQEPISMSAC